MTTRMTTRMTTFNQPYDNINIMLIMFVKQDSSVTEITHSQMGTQYSPVHSSNNSSYSSSVLCKSRKSKEPLEPPESEVGSQRHIRRVKKNSWRDRPVARVQDLVNYEEKPLKSDMQLYVGFVLWVRPGYGQLCSHMQDLVRTSKHCILLLLYVSAEIVLTLS
jgi:hypothetical protein